jgi:hypothetical protein
VSSNQDRKAAARERAAAIRAVRAEVKRERPAPVRLEASYREACGTYVLEVAQ